jgi:membrane protein involved in colicin uptake
MKKSVQKVSKKASLMVMGLATIGILGVGSLGASALSSSDSGQDGLAARLATKFGLNKDDVSKEIDSYREEEHTKREAEMKTKLSEALQKKVDDGTITAAQKTALEAKLEEKYKAREAEMKANKDSGSRLSKAEMKAKREAEKTEMDAWLKEQGINVDLKDLLSTPDGNGHGPGRRKGGDIN